MAGLQICYLWKDGFTLWERLSNLKESHPVHVASLMLHEELITSLNLCVKHVLKMKNRIVALEDNRHKFGKELPKMV